MVEYVHFLIPKYVKHFTRPKTNTEPEKNTQNAKMNIIFHPPSVLGSKCQFSVVLEIFRGHESFPTWRITPRSKWIVEGVTDHLYLDEPITSQLVSA